MIKSIVLKFENTTLSIKKILLSFWLELSVFCSVTFIFQTLVEFCEAKENPLALASLDFT